MSLSLVFLLLFDIFASVCLLCLVLLRLDKCAEHANFVVFVFLEVESVLFAKPELKQVVIERFFGDVNLCSCVFKRIADQVPVSEDSVVQLPPKADLLDDLFYGPLLCPLGFTS